jgi:hypothetical protein
MIWRWGIGRKEGSRRAETQHTDAQLKQTKESKVKEKKSVTSDWEYEAFIGTGKEPRNG